MILPLAQYTVIKSARGEGLMKPFVVPVVSFLLAAVAMIGSAQALPPEPASTAESASARALYDKIFIRNFASSNPNDPATIQLRSQLIAQLDAGCRKNDAWSCAQIVTLAPGWSHFPDPRATRQQYAVKAASLYAEFCEARPDTRDCTSAHEFLQSVEQGDKKTPASATDGLVPQWIRLARGMTKACHIPTLAETSDNLTDDQFKAALHAEMDAGKGYRGENCKSGLTILDKYLPVESKSMREAMCTRGREDACNKLGRLSQKQADEEAKLASSCEAGNGRDCAALASKWAYRKNFTGFGAEARKWSQKSFAKGFAMGCAIAGELLLKAEYGSPDYAASVDALGKACKTMPKEQAAQICKTEAVIRAALAGQKAKTVPPANSN